MDIKILTPQEAIDKGLMEPFDETKVKKPLFAYQAVGKILKDKDGKQHKGPPEIVYQHNLETHEKKILFETKERKDKREKLD